MPGFTKKAIKDSFIKLLGERPLSKITVKDIVCDCGVNRNTFYYHYVDIPSLLEEIIKEDADSIIDRYPSIDSIEKCLEVAIGFALDNKTAVKHIFNSLSRDVYEQYMMRICEYVITSYIDTLLSGRAVDAGDRILLIRLYKCEFFGIIVDWIGNGMTDDILHDFHRLCELRGSQAEDILLHCRPIKS